VSVPRRAIRDTQGRRVPAHRPLGATPSTLGEQRLEGLAPHHWALVDLQRTAGNRAVSSLVSLAESAGGPSGPIVQRQPAQALIDRRVQITAANRATVDGEIVPMGEGAGQYEGYASEAAAIAVAERSPEVTVVVRDKDKRFHVLRTTQTNLGDKSSAPENPVGWFIVRVVQTKAGTVEGGSWKADLDSARATSGPARRTAYQDLLARWTHLDPSEIGWSAAKDAYTAGMVCVAPWLPSNGRTEPADMDPTGSAAVPGVGILIAEARFGQGPEAVRTTLLHEQRHAYHTAHAADLVRQWRAVRREDTREAWRQWLRARRKALGTEIFETAGASTDTTRGTATTETYAYLHAFMHRFARLDAAETPAQEMTKTDRLNLHVEMAGLAQIGENWEASGQDLQDEVLAQLVAFLASYSAVRRANIAEFISSAGAARDAPKYFYKRLTAALGAAAGERPKSPAKRK
jgi:hypothetical protein